MDFPSEMTKRARDHANRRKNNYININNKQKEKALLKSIRIPYNKEPILVNKIAEDEVTAQIFGTSAQKYQEFLKERGIRRIQLVSYSKGLVDKFSKPFAMQLLFGTSWGDLTGKSIIHCCDWRLDLDYRVRGILKNN